MEINLSNSILKISKILVIRFLTLFTRFLFIIFFSKNYTLDVVGIYGLIYALTVLASQFIPFEFHNYVTLEVLDGNDNEKKKHITNSLGFTFFSLIIYLPLIFILFPLTNINSEYTLLTIMLIFFETVSREFERLFVGLSKPFEKYLSVFLKTFPWMFLILIFLLNDFQPDFRDILILWALSTALACFYGFFKIKNNINSIIKFRNYFSFEWIKKGLLFSLPFLIATLSNSLNQYVGRFFLSSQLSNELTGIFSIFFQLSAILLIISELSFSIYLPSFTKNIQSKLKSKNQKYEKLNLLLFIFLGFILYLFIPLIFNFINPELNNYLYFFAIMIIGMIFLAYSNILRMQLYVARFNYELMLSNLLCVLTSLIMNYFLIKKYGFYGSAIAFLIPSMVLCFLLIYFRSKFNRRIYEK